MAKRNQLASVALKKLPAGKYNDGGGLYLFVSDAGARSWVFRYKIHGRSRYMGLGALDDVGLAAAREEAHECRKLTKKGIDPLTERRAGIDAHKAAAGRSFRSVAAAFLDSKSVEWSNAKHRNQWVNTLEQYAYPKIGDLPVTAITPDSVLAVLRPIWKEKPETASRVRGRIERVLDYAAALNYIPRDSNPARWKGGLKEILPAPTKLRRTKHFAALNYDGINAFLVRLREQPGIAARALEFTILTAARTSEVRRASWSEFDLESGVWVIPADRMKAKREHRVPLCNRALAILGEVSSLSETWAFPTPRGEAPLSENAMLVLLRRMGVDVTTHGFRSAFRDWAAETTNFPREVVEMALAHSIRDKTEAAYRRGDLFAKRAELMRQWQAYCETPKPSGKRVVPIRRAG
jgi:integrase